MLSNHPNCLGGNGPSASSDLLGDVDGPASATDNAVARFDGTTGKLIQNSAVTVSDAAANNVTIEAAAATNLTLAGGSTGASLVLGQGTTAANASITPTGTGSLIVTKNSTGNNVPGIILKNGAAGYTELDLYSGVSDTVKLLLQASDVNSFAALSVATNHPLLFAVNASEKMRIATTGNVLIGGTTDISGTGGLKVAGTSTASSTTSGALQVGSNVGLSGNAGGASYFGGAVTSAGFYTGTGNSGAIEAKSSSAGVPVTISAFNTSTSASSDVAFGFQTQGSRNANWLLSRASGLLEMTDGYQTRGTVRVSFDPLNGNSVFGGTGTFAGAVSLSAGTLTATNASATQAIFKGWNSRSGANAQNGQIEIGTITGLRLMSDASGTGGSVIDDRWDNAASSIQFRLRGDGTPVTALTLVGTGAATFAGAVAIGNTVNTVSPTSPNRTVTMVIGGVTYYLAAKTTND